MAATISMSLSERERAAVVRQIASKQISQVVAAARLGIGVRQMKRVMQAWRLTGDAALVSTKRGQPSNRALPATLHAELEKCLRGPYQGVGATLVAEKLLEREGIAVSAETVRRAQIRLKLHRPKSRKDKRVFQLRERRARFGELVQIDGSPHAWFEARGPRCTLIVFIDDATSRLTGLRFVPAESTQAYLETLRESVLMHGCPLAFYSDRHGVFRVNAKDAQSGDGKTEFGRVAERLDIALIYAMTPQAKGRVERANRTMQERLLLELRLRNISTIADANAYLSEFIVFWNGRFATDPSDTTPAHRPWPDTPGKLEDALARREDRVLSKALTFSAAGTKYCIKTSGPGTALRGATVTLYHFVGGGMEVHYKDRVLPVTAYGAYPVPDPAEDEKTIDVRVDGIVKKAATKAAEGKILAAA
jgi:hypothetical protein